MKKIKLLLINKSGNNYSLPGKPLNQGELSVVIEKSRKSGSIFMEEAHLIIRKGLNAIEDEHSKK